MKKAFTIIELLLVVAIIAILLGIVTSAASGSVRMSRIRKAQALTTLVQSGLATYYAQKEEWPVSFSSSGGGNDQGTGGSSDENITVLSAAQVRQCVKALVDEAKKGNPMIDVSGLFVSRNGNDPVAENCKCKSYTHKRYRPAQGAYGMDFMQAVRGTKQSQKKMKTSEMYFGYPHPETGGFMRFYMTYSHATDTITVSQWHWGNE